MISYKELYRYKRRSRLFGSNLDCLTIAWKQHTMTQVKNGHTAYMHLTSLVCKLNVECNIVFTYAEVLQKPAAMEGNKSRSAWSWVHVFRGICLCLIRRVNYWPSSSPIEPSAGFDEGLLTPQTLFCGRWHMNHSDIPESIIHLGWRANT